MFVQDMYFSVSKPQISWPERAIFGCAISKPFPNLKHQCRDLFLPELSVDYTHTLPEGFVVPTVV